MHPRDPEDRPRAERRQARRRDFALKVSVCGGESGREDDGGRYAEDGFGGEREIGRWQRGGWLQKHTQKTEMKEEERREWEEGLAGGPRSFWS